MPVRLPAFLNRIKWALKKRLATASDRRHILFRYDGEGGLPDPDVRTIATVESLAECPGIERLADMPTLRRELAHGARVSFIAEDTVTLCYALHAPISDWFVPLGPSDEVIYSVVTARSAMGHGLAPRVARAIAGRVRAEGGASWLDCVKWNIRAHRAFEKAGFVRFGTADYPPRANSAA